MPAQLWGCGKDLFDGKLIIADGIYCARRKMGCDDCAFNESGECTSPDLRGWMDAPTPVQDKAETRNAEIARLYRLGVPVSILAQGFGLSWYVVKYVLTKNNVPRRGSKAESIRAAAEWKRRVASGLDGMDAGSSSAA
jgi:hypothetical protein